MPEETAYCNQGGELVACTDDCSFPYGCPCSSDFDPIKLAAAKAEHEAFMRHLRKVSGMDA